MTAPRGGYFGKILEIDLSRQKYKTREISDDECRKYIGGAGMGGYFLASEYKAHHDPLAEDSFIFIGVGPLNGTYCVSTRTSIVNMSPYTGLLSHAEVGAHLGNEIKWAGWDGIYIKGRSKNPVYLYIKDDKVQFRDAGKLWGKTTEDADESMRQEIDDSYARTAVIGPAGENGVPFAAVIIERFRAAARTGTGALMGNKKLKGIAVRGTKAVPVADNKKFYQAAKAAKQLAVDKEGWQGIKRWGTAGLLELKHWVSGSLITKNFQTTWYPDIEYIGGEEANRTFWKRHVACNHCPVHCQKYGVIREGKHAGLIAEGPEYETGGLLGSNLGMSDFAGMMAMIELCDAMGIDAISTGGVLAFTTECIDRGVLKPGDLDGVALKWGDADAYLEMIRKMAYQDGKGGKLLAKGVRKMSQEIGQGSEAWAVHVKGKEIAAHDPRGDKGRAYSYALGTCGGDHHEGGSPATQARWGMLNSLVMCSFVGGYPWGKETPGIFTAMLNPLCGWNMSDDEYWTTGKRIITIERCFQVREGINRKDDVLPTRFTTEKLPEGPKKGAIFTAEDTKKMQEATYSYFGWDDNGIPTDKTLKAYDLEYLVDDVREAKKAL
ncbi:MAG: aldehyde ferredoxin oxidoreductase family protein [Deltaproteobacteria bacterium]|nr:aldehyde ferredoxin oxidoreductase family protein [Deltaproteobacteria bacterium]